MDFLKLTGHDESCLEIGMMCITFQDYIGVVCLRTVKTSNDTAIDLLPN